MFKTGISSIDYLGMVISFLPFLSALLIFGRRLYLQEPLNFLLIICLLGFFRGILEFSYSLTSGHQSIVDKLFSLVLFLLLVACFRANLDSQFRYLLDVLLAAVLSLAVTWWSLKGWEVSSPGIDVCLNVFLGGVILVSLPAVVRTGALQVFRSPLFWIGGGTLFYILLYLLLAGIGNARSLGSVPPVGGSGTGADPDKRIFLLLADGVKYLFYLAAVVATPRSSLAPPQER